MIKLLLVLCSIFILVGCQVPQQDTEVSFVPIDEIKVEDSETGEESDEESEDDSEEMDSEEMKEGSEEMDSEEMDKDHMDEEETTIDDILESLEDETIADKMEDTEESEEGSEEDSENTEEPEESGQEPLETEGSDESEEESEETMSSEESSVGNEIVIIVSETETVSLKPAATDPDGDELFYTYTTPLSEAGSWETTYGDEGEYTVTITVSDGELTSSKDALLIVNKKEEVPTIDLIIPKEDEQEIKENSELEFSIEASDLNSDPLTYVWTLNGEEVSEEDSFVLEADYDSAGSHEIQVDVSDGANEVSQLWTITIENVDRPPKLETLADITVKETETVVIEPLALDPDDDEITYTISDPVGDSGVWETDYDSAGVYTITITASDGELDDEQEVKVTVINVNRPPVIDDIIQVE